MKATMAVLLVLLAAVPLLAQQQGGSPADMEAAMKQYEAMVAPGPQHEALAKMAGTWKSTQKWWMMPNTEPMVTTGTSTARMDMDGRYLIEESQTTMMGKPYRGLNIVAFDKFRGEYQMIYIDNMGTGIVSARGKADADSKIHTLTGTMDDIMTGQKDLPMRYVMTVIDDDHHVFEMYGPGPDGKEFKTMEITYERVK